MDPLAAHMCVGYMFACTSLCSRKLCKHKIHQFMFGVSAVAVESIVTFAVIG